MTVRKVSDFAIKVRQAFRAGPRRLLLRAVYRAKVQLLSKMDVARASGLRDSDVRSLAPVSAIAEEILRWRSAIYSPDRKAVEAGAICLRGRQESIGPLDLIDWSMLGRGEPEMVNQEFELAYMGYAVPAAKKAAEDYFGYLARVVLAIERGGDASLWSHTIAWKPISVSCRLLNLIAIIHFGKVSGALEPRDERILSRHAELCARFLERFREDYLGYNHLAFNLVSILCWRVAVSAPVSPAFERYLVKILDEQISADGGQAERAPGYHVHVLSLVKLAFLASRPETQISAHLQAILTRMTSALEVMVHPDGDIALFNDSSIGDAPPAWLYLEDDRREPSKRILSVTGLAKLDASDCAVLMDTGPQLEWRSPGHGHAGYLSCEVSWKTMRFVVDPGVASYVAGDARTWTKSGQSHNGPRIRQREVLQFAGAFGIGRYSIAKFVEFPEVNSVQSIFAEYSPYFSNERVKRGIIQDKSSGHILIVDTWSRSESACDSYFCIEGKWNPAGGFQSNEFEFSRGGEDVVFRVLLGELKNCAKLNIYPRGPTDPELAHCLSVSPVRSNDRMFRVVAVGKRETLVELERVASDILSWVI